MKNCTKYQLPFNVKGCDGIDAMINSTHRVFGDTAPGQILALAGAEKIPGYCCLAYADICGIFW